MNTKRGMFLVVLAVVLSLALVVAEESQEASGVLKKYNSLVKGTELTFDMDGDIHYGSYELDHDNTCGGPGAADYSSYNYCNDDDWIDCDQAYDCDCNEGDWGDPDAPGAQSLPADKGCYIRGHDEEDIGDQPCGWMKLASGTVIKKGPFKLPELALSQGG